MRPSTLTASLAYLVLSATSAMADSHSPKIPATVNGKPTTSHINERLVTEAQLLLSHTDWGVGEIAYSLGFEYPTYFNNFFKKHTGTTPLTFRRAHVPTATA